MLRAALSFYSLALVIVGCSGRSERHMAESAEAGEAGSSQGEGGSVGEGGRSQGGSGGRGGTSGTTGGTSVEPTGGTSGSANGGDGAGGSNVAGGGVGGASPGGAGAGAGVGGAGVGGAIGGAGTGGTVGGAGSGGTSGMSCGGSAGADACRSCVSYPSLDLVESCVRAADATFVTESFSATVTVISIDEVAGGNCGQVDRSYSTAPTLRLVLEAADQRRWTVYLRIPGLSREFVMAGNVLELSVNAGYPFAFSATPQTISLSRADDVLAFGASSSSTPLGLDSLGITLMSLSANCTPTTCTVVDHPLVVRVGTEEATFVPGETRTLGSYSVTVDESNYVNGAGVGGCDGAGLRHLAGVALPP